MRENIRERGGLNGGDLIEFSRDYPRGALHQTESRVRRAKPTAPSTEPPTGHATRTGNSRIQILPTRLLRVFVPSSAATTARRRAPRAHKRTRGARESAPRPGTTSEGRYLPSLFAVVSTPPGVCPARGDHRTRISRGLRVRRKTRQHERFSSPRRLEASARVPRARPRTTRTATAGVGPTRFPAHAVSRRFPRPRPPPFHLPRAVGELLTAARGRFKLVCREGPSCGTRRARRTARVREDTRRATDSVRSDREKG